MSMLTLLDMSASYPATPHLTPTEGHATSVVQNDPRGTTQRRAEAAATTPEADAPRAALASWCWRSG